MGFTNKPHSAIKYIKIQGLKKEVEKHFFELDGFRVEDSTFEAKLIKITPSEYEYEGVMRQTAKLLFIDEQHEYYQLDIAMNGLSRGLLNTLLGYIDGVGVVHGKIDLELSLYLNKDNYKQMGIKINGERGKWRYDIEAQRKMIEIIIRKNGTKENDYFEYDEKLKSCIQEIQDFITISDFIDEEKVNKEKVNKVSKKEYEISIEDIPF